jgi:TonB-linked SusC/RagA family outer membrane protein
MLSKKLFFMRITAFFLVAVTLHVSAKGLSQNISLDEEKAPLKKVFADIQTRSGLAIIYDNHIVKNIPPVDLHVRDVPVGQALDKALAGLPLSWFIEDKIIFIKIKKDENPTPVATPPVETVTGVIKDENGQPMEGVSITVKAHGFERGGATNVRGEFSLAGIPDGQYTLEVSAVGYQKYRQPIVVNGSTPALGVAMKVEASSMNETVVIAYGTAKRKDLTGSISTINAAKEFKDLPVPRIDQMLQGRAAGVDVKSINGAPGSGTSIRIRGSRSINATNEPIYVIDGLVGTGDLNTLNPDDIESISILKDASAAAIYGSRAANGVVIVTTKRGKAGKDRVNVSATYGIQQLPKTLDMMNAKDFAQFENDSRVDQGFTPLYTNIDSLVKAIGNGTNWTKATTRTAPYTNYNLSLSGGSTDMTYYLSGNVMKQEGIVIGADYNRYQLHLNLDKQISPKLKWGTSLNLSRYRQDNSQVDFGTSLGWETSMESLPPTMPVYNPDGTLNAFNPIYYQGGGNINSPVAKAKLITDYNVVTTMMGNVYGEYEIVKGLKLRSTLGTNLSGNKHNGYTPSYMPANIANNTQTGSATTTRTFSDYLLNENTLNYEHSFGVHHLNLTAGSSYQYNESDEVTASASGLTDDILQYNNLGVANQANKNVGSNATSTTLISGFGRVNYDYAGKYYLTLTGRYDGASNFAADKKWGFFPSGAFKWNVWKENFFQQLGTAGTLDNLSFRASYGSSGNQGIAAYSSLASLTSQGTAYLFGQQPAVGFYQGNLANNNLSWETTSELNIGTDMQLFKGRISLTADYYNMHTRNLLLSVQIPQQTGYGSQLVNIGKTMSEGFEVTATAAIIKGKDFSWSTTITASTNKQEVLDLGPLVMVSLDNNSYGANTNYLEKGVPVGANFGLVYAGTWKNQQEINTELAKPAGKRDLVSTSTFYLPGKPRYKDYDHDGQLTINDYHYLGTPNPKFFGGVGNTFTYKGLALDVFFQYSSGATMFNDLEFFTGSGTYLTNQYNYIKNRWSPTNPNSDIPAVNSRDNVSSTRELHDASFIRLKSVRMSYDLTKLARNKVVKSANIFLAGTNLFLRTKYNGFDPEVNTGDASSGGTSSTVRAKDNGAYPNARTISAGLNVGF